MRLERLHGPSASSNLAEPALRTSSNLSSVMQHWKPMGQEVRPPPACISTHTCLAALLPCGLEELIRPGDDQDSTHKRLLPPATACISTCANPLQPGQTSLQATDCSCTWAKTWFPHPKRDLHCGCECLHMSCVPSCLLQHTSSSDHHRIGKAASLAAVSMGL